MQACILCVCACVRACLSVSNCHKSGLKPLLNSEESKIKQAVQSRLFDLVAVSLVTPTFPIVFFTVQETKLQRENCSKGAAVERGQYTLRACTHLSRQVACD